MKDLLVHKTFWVVVCLEGYETTEFYPSMFLTCMFYRSVVDLSQG